MIRFQVEGLERNPDDVFGLGFFPLGQLGFEFRRRLFALLFQPGNRGLEPIHFLALLAGRERQRRTLVRLIVVLGLIEECVELVILPLRDGIVFMRVALRAAQGEAHPDLCGRVGAVFHRSDAKFLVVGAALGVGHRVTMKRGGLPVFLGRVRKQVTGDLFHRKTVVRQVPVQGPNYPIAPRPDVQAERVGAVAGGIGIAGEVEPRSRPTFAIRGRAEQAVHQPFAGIASGVVHERVHLRRRWRQTGQIQRQAANQRVTIGWWRGFQSILLQLRENEEVDGVPRP